LTNKINEQAESDLRHTIKISDDAHIGGTIWMEPHTRLGEVEVFPNCRMGMHSYMVSGLMRSTVSVGRYCSIGRGVSVGTGEHALEALSTGGPIQNNYASKQYSVADKTHNIRTLIKDDVWIGDNATIFSGVTIGMGAVIGTGAVVTSDIPDYAVAVGIPARVMKYRFEDHIIEQLIKSEWYNYDPEDILSICNELIEMDTFLECLQKSGFTPVFEKEQYIEISKRAKNTLLRSKIDRLDQRIMDLNNKVSKLSAIISNESEDDV